MRVIQTKEDIECLRRANALPEPYLGLVEGDFQRVQGGVEAQSGPGAYHPGIEGYFVVLEEGDNLRNLEVVGLDPGEGGLLGCAPEAVDLLEPAPGLKVFQVLVAYNNSSLMSFYLEKGLADPEVEAWLKKNLIDSDTIDQQTGKAASTGGTPDSAGVPF